MCRKVISSSRFAGFVSVFKLHWYYHLSVKTQNVISSEGQIGLSLVSEWQRLSTHFLGQNCFQLYQLILSRSLGNDTGIRDTLGIQVWESTFVGRTSWEKVPSRPNMVPNILTTQNSIFMLDIHTEVQTWTGKVSIIGSAQLWCRVLQNPIEVRVIQVSYRQHITETGPLFGTVYKEMLSKTDFFFF